MRFIILLAGSVLCAAPVIAQTVQTAPGQTTPHPATGTEREPSAAESEARSPGAPLDRGPPSAEADRAHRGGGVVLEGPPGAPAPAPMPTPSRAPR